MQNEKPKIVVIAVLASFFALVTMGADGGKGAELLERAKAAAAKGDREAALNLASEFIKSEPKAEAYFFRGRIYESSSRSVEALRDYDEALKLEPGGAKVWQERGVLHFRLAHIEESLRDFDQFLKIVPKQAPYHWQRGIACYYAGRFEEGRKQFELHQTVNPDDVENAAWHFLCVAKSSGLEAARAKLIPIKGDPRVPMKEIHALFAGKATPDDVLRAAGANEPESRRALLYAHLYLGLYFEVTGEAEKSREHIALAAGKYRTPDYMGDVAVVHSKLKRPHDKPAASK